jgi:hypothetical protein
MVEPPSRRLAHLLRRWLSAAPDFLNRHLKEDVNKAQFGRHAPRMYKFGPALATIFVGALVLGWLLFAGLARLSGSNVAWWWPDRGSLSKDRLFDVTRSAATIAALFGGLFAILYAYRKQRVEEAAGHRSDAEALSKRYQDAAEQLGHGKAAVRLAGVYAMARLADDWPEQRQTCVNVLCAYLRATSRTLEPDSDRWAHVKGEDIWPDGEHEVRLTITSVIRDHLQADSVPSWSDLEFNLEHVQFVNADFSQAIFARRPRFASALFSSTTFEGAIFYHGGDFSDVFVAYSGVEGYESKLGDLAFANVQVLGGSIDMAGMKISSGANAFIGPKVLSALTILTLDNPHVYERGTLDLNLHRQKLPAGQISMNNTIGYNSGTITIGSEEYNYLDHVPKVSIKEWDTSHTPKISQRLLDDGVVVWTSPYSLTIPFPEEHSILMRLRSQRKYQGSAPAEEWSRYRPTHPQ